MTSGLRSCKHCSRRENSRRSSPSCRDRAVTRCCGDVPKARQRCCPRKPCPPNTIMFTWCLLCAGVPASASAAAHPVPCTACKGLRKTCDRLISRTYLGLHLDWGGSSRSLCPPGQGAHWPICSVGCHSAAVRSTSVPYAAPPSSRLAVVSSVRSVLQEKAKPVPAGRVFSSRLFLKRLQRPRRPGRGFLPLRQQVTGDTPRGAAGRSRPGPRAAATLVAGATNVARRLVGSSGLSHDGEGKALGQRGLSSRAYREMYGKSCGRKAAKAHRDDLGSLQRRGQHTIVLSHA